MCDRSQRSGTHESFEDSYQTQMEQKGGLGPQMSLGARLRSGFDGRGGFVYSTPFPAPPSCQTGRGEAGGDRAREPGLCHVGATAADMDKGPQSRAQSPQMSAVAEISLTTT